jgi:hypothetical protein
MLIDSGVGAPFPSPFPGNLESGPSCITPRNSRVPATSSNAAFLEAQISSHRLVKREKELHREILAFSISHGHRTVRIYGHYPVINGEKTTFYRTRSRSLASRAKKVKTSGPRKNSPRAFTVIMWPVADHSGTAQGLP